MIAVAAFLQATYTYHVKVSALKSCMVHGACMCVCMYMSLPGSSCRPPDALMHPQAE